MIIQTFKCNLIMSCLTTIWKFWITNDRIHCSLPSQLPMTGFTAVFHPNYQNLQKVGHDIVIFSGNVLGRAWQTWRKKGTNEKRTSCSLLIGYMQIFKLIDFRTIWVYLNMGYFFHTHCLTVADTGETLIHCFMFASDIRDRVFIISSNAGICIFQKSTVSWQFF